MKLRKPISMVMVLVLLLSLCSVSAFATESTEESATEVTESTETEETTEPTESEETTEPEKTYNFVDEFEDFSKMYAYSNNHGGWGLNTNTLSGIDDTTHLSRKVTELDASEDVTYCLPNLQDFKLTVAAHANSYGTINLYTSSDGDTWTNQTYTVTGTLHWNWASMVLTPAEGVNAGANYLKIEVAAHPKKTWGTMLGRFEAVWSENLVPAINSAKMVDEALAVSFKPVKDANSYTVNLSVDGEVVKSVQTEKATCNIYGVTPGATYVATVTAHTGTTDVVSEGISVTIPATTSFVDECTDFSKVYYLSNNYGGWKLSTSTLNGIGSADTTHIARNITNVNAVEHLIYYLPNLQDFKLMIACFGKSYGTIKLYTSPDGEIWTEQAYTRTGTVVSQWARIAFTPTDGVNAGANYLKIEFGYHFKTYGTMLGRVEATLRSTVGEELANVIALIDAIGIVTVDSGDAIEAARTAYDALPEEQKPEVDNYEVLTQAEERYAALTASKVESWNLILGDDIGLNFLVSVEEAYVDQTYVQITVADDTPVSYKVSDFSPDENGYYLFSANVAAAQMTDEIKLQIVAGEEEIFVKTYTVEQYAQTLLADESMSTYHALVKEMLNYGAAAQTYFNYNTENTIDESLYTGAGANEISSEGVENKLVSGSADGISFYGASLVHRSKIAVRFYYTVDGDISNYTFKLGDQVLSATAKDGVYYVEVADINPQDMDKAVTLTVANGDEVLSVSYSPMNYIVKMSEKGSDNIKPLVKAMYNYHLAAKTLTENA